MDKEPHIIKLLTALQMQRTSHILLEIHLYMQRLEVHLSSSARHQGHQQFR